MINLPRNVNGYTLTESLRKNGDTFAYRGEDSNGTPIFVKTLKFGSSTGSFKPQELLEREAGTLRELRHDRIPAFRDYFCIESPDFEGTTNFWFYLVQEFLDGKSLKQLREERTFSEEEVIGVGLQLCDVLGYLHRQDSPIIHRDIKPSNIMLRWSSEELDAVLVDFGGLQKIALESLLQEGGSTCFGTLGYAAPEQFMPNMASHPQSDLYALGVTFLHLLSGKNPREMYANGKIDFSQHYQFGNPSLELVVNQLIQPRLEDRFQTAEEVANYLQRIKDGKTLKFQSKQKPKVWARFVSWLANLGGQSTIESLVALNPEGIRQASRRPLITSSESTHPRPLPGDSDEIPEGTNYILMPRAGTYAKGVQQLHQAGVQESNDVHRTHQKQDGTFIYRPLRLRTNLQARVEKYRRHDSDDPERLKFFNTYLDSCCGAAYKRGTTKVKFNTLCRELIEIIEIDPEFSGYFLPVDYDSLRESDGWIELDSSDSNFKEEAWNVVLDGSTRLYQAHKNIVLAEKPNALLDFWVRRNTPQDELRAVCVVNLDDSSYVGGDGSLYNGARFLRASPKH